MSAGTIDQSLADKLVRANRILYDQGIVDGLGHVSARDELHPQTFLLSCNRAPGMVIRRDIVRYDYNGNAVSETAERPYLERFIHAEIYRVRPEVMAIVHSHSPSVIPFGAANRTLRPIFHMAGFLGTGAAHFDIRTEAGETDMLVRTPALGASLAKSLGACSCVLMRGHGSTVVGHSVEQAVYRAIYAEINAKLQLSTYMLGEPIFLTEKEAELAAAANDTQIQRSWNLWVDRVLPIND